MGSTSFLGFSYPNLLLVLFFVFCFSEPVFHFSVPYFELACDHGNSFLCLEESKKEKGTG